MRRPIPVKSFFCSPMISSFFFRSAKPPLSPPFHPHSYVSDSRSVPVGCSRFSRRCHLVIVLFLTFWVGIGRRHLSQSPKLGGPARLFGYKLSLLRDFRSRFWNRGASAPHS